MSQPLGRENQSNLETHSDPGNSAHQEEQLRILGDRLRQVRLEKRLSLQQVALKTRIRPRLLEAIETGNLQQLPEPVYIQGLLRRFAEAVDLDGEALAEEFFVERPRKTGDRTWLHLPIPHLRPMHLYLLYIAIVACSVQGLSYLMSRNEARVGQGEPAPESIQLLPATPQPEPKLPALRSASMSDAPSRSTSTSNSKPIQVSLTFRDESWVKIEVDGETEFEGILPEGTERTWAASKELVIRAGNAGGVFLVHNDGKAEQMGKPGAVKEVTFTADSRS